MKQTDNRQKQVVQARAERTLKSPKTSKPKEHVHVPGEHEHSETGEKKEVTQYVAGPKVGRNDPCPCGSKKKYKKCCLDSPKK